VKNSVGRNNLAFTCLDCEYTEKGGELIFSLIFTQLGCNSIFHLFLPSEGEFGSFDAALITNAITLIRAGMGGIR